MADVTLTYKGQTILELNESGNKTIKTAGKYCEADIGLSYVKSSGGGRCPRQNPVASFSMASFLGLFQPTATAEEYTDGGL